MISLVKSHFKLKIYYFLGKKLKCKGPHNHLILKRLINQLALSINLNNESTLHFVPIPFKCMHE